MKKVDPDVTTLVIRDWVVAQKEMQIKLLDLQNRQAQYRLANTTAGRIEAYNLMLAYLDSCEESSKEAVNQQ